MDTPKPKRRWMPIVLGLSLALNLAVIAAVAGAAWRFHDGGGPRDRGVPRFDALYLRALDREDRREIRQSLRQIPRPSRDEMERVVSLLKSEPFDEAAVRDILTQQRAESLRRRDAVSEGWLTRITAMTSAERAAYAARIEALMTRRKGGSHKD